MSNRGEGESGKNGGIEESLPPDLLKNTPSNIARLEDVIEHSKGRQKYLAQTRSPSDGSDVRWYFCKVPLAYNELAASVPNAEIVGKSEYFRFGMRDSLAIEASFLQREDELLSAWWKEYADCSEGPRDRASTSNKSKAQSQAAGSGGQVSASIYPLDEERVGVPVKGGLYEVDLLRRHCFPVYWNGENRRVLRGHWFALKGGLDWLPLREDVSEQLEYAYCSQVWHRRTFQPSGLFAARIDLQGSTPGLHALFTGEDDTWEAWLNVDATGFSCVISISGNGIKLRRGYSSSQSPKPTQEELRQQKEEEMDDYCSQVPVRHLVFMVHGIGQRLEKSNLVDDVSNFRHITELLAEQHLTSYQRHAQRVLFIPCQWRKALKLSGEAAVEKITLDGVRGLRTTLSATVHDVLYYMSPIYCQDIIDSVSNQLNRLYLKFLKRNPGYDGKVSLYGHSLGSVLSYDILCHQEKLSSPFPMDSVYKRPELDIKYLKNKDQASLCSRLENTDVSLTHDTMEKIICTYDDREDSKPTLMVPKEGVRDSSFDSPLKSESTEFSTKALEPDKPIIMEDIYESSCDFSNMISQETSLEEMTRISCETSNQCLEKVAIKASEDTTTKARGISVLENEIDSLRAKVAELESRVCRRDAGDMIKPEQTSYGKMPTGQNDVPKSYTPYIRFTKLEFKVDTFFAVGSPLGVFLALRNVRIGIGKGEDYWSDENIMEEEMPACRQMFNIFHPFDPVAYRVEPLVCKEYITKRPVIVPYHKGGKRLHIGLQEFAEDMAARSQAIVDRFNVLRVKVLTVCQSRNANSLEEATEDSEENKGRSYGSLMMERLTGSVEGRMDYVLQDKTFQHPYISAIGSHTNYWRDYDTALFILRHLYRDIPEEPKFLGEAYASTKANSGYTDWINRKEVAEEKLPLLPSDRN